MIYFEGASAIRVEQFRKINGFSNVFWGWGGEDDDMFWRIQFHGLQITRLPANIGRYTMIKHKNYFFLGGFLRNTGIAGVGLTGLRGEKTLEEGKTCWGEGGQVGQLQLASFSKSLQSISNYILGSQVFPSWGTLPTCWTSEHPARLEIVLNVGIAWVGTLDLNTQARVGSLIRL